MKKVTQMMVISFASLVLYGAVAAGAPLAEFETPAMIYHGQGSGNKQIAFALDDNLEKWSKPIAIEPLTASGEKPKMNHWDPDCWLRDGTYPGK